ncbi:MAG: HAD-IG family 5'-nucleotidase [Planctomycetota bacterium]
MSVDSAPVVPTARGVFCNRTLNMRSIQAVGFDMDYTLVHYDEHAWEARAYAHVRQRLVDQGLPVADLRFDPSLFTRGLIVDTELGNIVKASRFGYVTQAAHGTRMLDLECRRRTYSQVWVDLGEPRWVFLNTLFSLSEACLFGQLVDLRDEGRLPGSLDYEAIYALARDAIDAAHLEGQLKAEIIAEPEHFVVLDADLADALLDLKQAGKRLFLATNSEWHYTRAMMSYAFDRFLSGPGWRDLFELVIVQARKPRFFDGSAEFTEIDEESEQRDFGRTVDRLEAGRVYRGGNAQDLQTYLGLGGAEILYVGDHVYADVHVSSRIRRWRTALVLRELEAEVEQEQAFRRAQRELQAGMEQKGALEAEQALLRLALQRLQNGRTLPAGVSGDEATLRERLRHLRGTVDSLDLALAPLAQRASQLGNERWGPLMRSGNDKSRLARQIERHADIYTSRVSNLLYLTPFGYLRAARGSLPHDACGP